MTGAGAGQPGVELADGQAGDGIAPRGGDPGGGREDEVSGAEQRVRDDQAWLGVSAAAPQDNVEIEHARCPTPAAAAPAELALEALEPRQQRGGIDLSFDYRGGVGVAPQRRTDRVGQQYRRRVAHLHPFAVEPLERGGEHVARAAEAVMAPVGAERDQVAPGFFGVQMSSQMRP